MNAFMLMIMMALAWPSKQAELWKGTGGIISFTSDAPLELIEAESNKLTGILNVKENTFAFLISTKTFEGFNSPLQQEHFHENYMDSEKYPSASFSGKFIEDVSELELGKYELRAKGMLKIHGVTVERIIKCSMEIESNKIRIESNFVVPLEDHKISIPQIVHQKIAEEIFVTAKITLQAS
ncbi:YceI family protein [Owenweeksia hongkongensis]|uniref:YceI family protein n=1 Tax=Owenweeksia hongkongensis TaxID=253245 RepID=UPI003A92F1BB